MDLRAREHQLRSQALDALVAQALIEKEAEARGTTPEALYEAEVEAKAVVTDADAQAYYAANKARFGTSTEAEALGQIKAGLGQQRQNERRAAFASRAAREVRREGAARAVPRPGRGRRRPRARQPEGPGHDRRVLGLPVPVLRARASRGRPGARGLRRQGALRLPALPPRLPPAGGEGRGSGGLRRGAGEVLGDARPALDEHREAAGARPQGPRRDAGPRRGGVRPVPRLGPPLPASSRATSRPARATGSRGPRRSSSTAGRWSAPSRSRRSPQVIDDELARLGLASPGAASR